MNVEYLNKNANKIHETPDLNPNNFMYLMMAKAKLSANIID
jgi:hypothetical protein